jgi:hypothetical protein
MIRALLIALVACNSWVGVPPVSFVPASTYSVQTQFPLTKQAITVRGVESVLAAGGRYLGIVISDGRGTNPSVAAVRYAASKAAEIGGTHILLRQARVDKKTKTTAMVGQKMEGYVETRDDEVHAVFDVFRVEPDRWGMLHPQMRPIPTP